MRLSAPHKVFTYQRNNTILVRITWVYFLDKTEGAADRSGQKLRVVVGEFVLQARIDST
jgi:hypothetical protein